MAPCSLKLHCTIPWRAALANVEVPLRVRPGRYLSFPDRFILQASSIALPGLLSFLLWLLIFLPIACKLGLPGQFGDIRNGKAVMRYRVSTDFFQASPNLCAR